MAASPLFEELVARHSAEIYAYLWRLMGSPEDAQDCLQEAFLRAFNAYPKQVSRHPAPEINYRAWLYKIAANLAHTHLKRRSRANSRTLDLLESVATEDPPVPEQVQRRLTLEEVRSAVEGLPHKQRSALLMRKYQGLSYDEIGAVLDCTPESARANVYQALKKLRAQFKPSEPSQERTL